MSEVLAKPSECQIQLAPALNDMVLLVHDLRRIGQSLAAISAISTAGNPAQTDLGVLSSEDLGALLATLADSTTTKTARLELLLLRALDAARHC